MRLGVLWPCVGWPIQLSLKLSDCQQFLSEPTRFISFNRYRIGLMGAGSLSGSAMRIQTSEFPQNPTSNPHSYRTHRALNPHSKRAFVHTKGSRKARMEARAWAYVKTIGKFTVAAKTQCSVGPSIVLVDMPCFLPICNLGEFCLKYQTFLRFLDLCFDGLEKHFGRAAGFEQLAKKQYIWHCKVLWAGEPTNYSKCQDEAPEGIKCIAIYNGNSSLDVSATLGAPWIQLCNHCKIQ